MIFRNRVSISRFLNLTKSATPSVLEADVIELIPQKSNLAKLLYLSNFHLKLKHLIVVVLVFVVGLTFIDLRFWPLMIFAAAFGCFFVILSFAKSAVASFKQQFPYFLLTLKSLLKSGADCVQAITIALENVDKSTLLYREFHNFTLNIKKYDFKTAIRLLGDSMDIKFKILNFNLKVMDTDPSLTLLKNALYISSQEGAGLSNFVERVVKYCRLSEQFSQKVKSVTVIQQISGVSIALLAFAPLVFKFFNNRKEFYDLVTDPLGVKLIGVSTVLILVGLISLFIICNKRL